MSWLDEAEISRIGLKSVGKNVLISSRAVFYGAEDIIIGDNSRIDDLCILSGKITIGRNVHIAVMCNVAGGDAGITFDDFSGLSYGCQVFAQSDDYSGKTLTNPTVPDKFKAEKKAAVHIGRHVIVGVQSVIMHGVTVAEGCSIGAMSLVRKSTTPWGIYNGMPAKRLTDRKRDLLILEQQFLDEGRKNS